MTLLSLSRDRTVILDRSLEVVDLPDLSFMMTFVAALSLNSFLSLVRVSCPAGTAGDTLRAQGVGRAAHCEVSTAIRSFVPEVVTPVEYTLHQVVMLAPQEEVNGFRDESARQGSMPAC